MIELLRSRARQGEQGLLSVYDYVLLLMVEDDILDKPPALALYLELFYGITVDMQISSEINKIISGKLAIDSLLTIGKITDCLTPGKYSSKLTYFSLGYSG